MRLCVSRDYVCHVIITNVNVSLSCRYCVRSCVSSDVNVFQTRDMEKDSVLWQCFLIGVHVCRKVMDNCTLTVLSFLFPHIPS